MTGRNAPCCQAASTAKQSGREEVLEQLRTRFATLAGHVVGQRIEAGQVWDLIDGLTVDGSSARGGS